VTIRPEEITSILKQRIEDYDVETNLTEVGTVLQVGDGLARVYGLENCIAMEMLELEHGVTGIAFNLEEDNVGSPLFGDWDKVSEGEPVKRTGKVVSGKLVTDGPYAEAKDIVLGFIVVEARDLAEATELSRACPIAIGGGSVEVRPVMASPM